MKVRFHLANGEHFMHWQVRDGRSVRYYKPEAFSLQMNGCSLVNKAGAAGRIHRGSHKTVCAWIECESLEVSEIHDTVSAESQARLFGIFQNMAEDKVVRFNPRVTPNWTDSSGENLDGGKFGSLFTLGRNVFKS